MALRIPHARLPSPLTAFEVSGNESSLDPARHIGCSYVKAATESGSLIFIDRGS
jgi:hypothetical protein